MYRGVIQNDLGPLTDVLENVSKAKGMRMLIRSMAPNVIFCDEIGSREDVEAIRYAMLSGVKGVFTAHGSGINDIKGNSEINDLLENHLLKKVIILDNLNKGKIKEIYEN